METIFDNIPVAIPLIALGLIEATLIYLFITFRHYMQKRSRRMNRSKQLKCHTDGLYGCDQATSERMFRKITNKINRDNAAKEQPLPKIIVSTVLYSDFYFFTEN
jgi:hypothetical protein